MIRDRKWLAPEGAGGAGAPEGGAGAGSPTGAGNSGGTPAGGAPAPQPAPAPGPQPAPEARYTQAQLDAAVQKAVAARVKELNAAHAQEMEDRELDYALRGAVTDAQDADLVLGLLDRGKLKRKDGKVEGLDEQLQALRKSKPFLFVQKGAESPKLSGAQPAGGGSPAGTSAPTRYTREQIARMTPQEINAHWDDVSASLNS